VVQPARKAPPIKARYFTFRNEENDIAKHIEKKKEPISFRAIQYNSSTRIMYLVMYAVSHFYTTSDMEKAGWKEKL
jgi:hypothetical protein